MSRLNVMLVAIVALLAGGFATYVYQNNQQASQNDAQMTDASVRAIVTEVLAAQPAEETQMSVAKIDAATIHPMIESYLLSNPRILERVSNALQAEIKAEEIEKTKAALVDVHDDIYNATDDVVLGNPDGDVTLVEMFDYNCGYCRSSVPDMISLLESDPDLKIILKEFPILSQNSVDAARIAVAVQRAGGDYWAFHLKLFGGRGTIDKAAAIAAAEDQGLSRVALELDAESEDVTQTIQRSYRIAQAVGTSGTPTYIIGDEVIPGAIGLAELQMRISNIRSCGKTMCES